MASESWRRSTWIATSSLAASAPSPDSTAITGSQKDFEATIESAETECRDLAHDRQRQAALAQAREGFMNPDTLPALILHKADLMLAAPGAPPRGSIA
jgi:hypothetical protein